MANPKQPARLKKAQKAGTKAIKAAAIKAAGSVHGDAAVLLDICEEIPHIAAMNVGWPPTSSDLSQVQLAGVKVNSTGQVTELDLKKWELAGENLCSTSCPSECTNAHFSPPRVVRTAIEPSNPLFGWQQVDRYDLFLVFL